jgi:hypothetical protein
MTKSFEQPPPSEVMALPRNCGYTSIMPFVLALHRKISPTTRDKGVRERFYPWLNP